MHLHPIGGSYLEQKKLTLQDHMHTRVHGISGIRYVASNMFDSRDLM